MKIFHGIVEIAGQMGILCGALKKRGHIATGYNTFHSYLGYQEHLINTDAGKIQEMFETILNFHDIFHYHYGATIWSNYTDLARIKAAGKKAVMHHWGNDVRFHDLARINNPYVYTGDSPPNHIIGTRLANLALHISDAIVQDHEVLPYVTPYYKNVHILPLAIDLEKFPPHYPDINKTRPLILHAPTNPEFKGTMYIETAIAHLRLTHDFEYKRLEKLNHAQVIQLYRDADIIIDQILCGSHGLLCVESMALGKPVISYIRPDLVPTFPADIPVVNANPATITEQLRTLIENPALRNTLGIQGRQYAEKYHSRDVVVDKLLTIYANLA